MGETGILQRSGLAAWHRLGLNFVAWALIGWTACGYEIVLPMPSRHFNDYAHVMSAGVATELDQTLEQLERKTSARVMVVVLRKMESDLPIEEYTAGIAKSWGVGEYQLANSAVLFVFAEPRRAWLQVGTGLEKALPDATVDSIISTILNPSLARGEFDTGLRASVVTIVHQVEAAKPAMAETKPAQREPSRTNEVRATPPVMDSKPSPPVAWAEVAPPTVPSQPPQSLPTVVKSQTMAPARPPTNEIKEAKALSVSRPADAVPPAQRAGTAATNASKAALAAYDNAVIEKVQNRWNAFVERLGSYKKSGKVTVEFQLLEDGSIQGLKSTDETGDKVLRLYCEKAVLESAPFTPMSTEMRKLANRKPRDVEMTFQY